MTCTPVRYQQGLLLFLHARPGSPRSTASRGDADGTLSACTLSARHVVACDRDLVFVDEYELALVFADAPKRVSVAAFRDDVLRGQGTFRPDYLHDEPNGEGCGWRTFAEETLELPGPTPCGVDDTCRCVYEDGCGCDTDQLPPWPWTTCVPGTVPADACDPSRCTCEGGGGR